MTVEIEICHMCGESMCIGYWYYMEGIALVILIMYYCETCCTTDHESMTISEEV